MQVRNVHRFFLISVATMFIDTRFAAMKTWHLWHKSGNFSRHFGSSFFLIYAMRNMTAFSDEDPSFLGKNVLSHWWHEPVVCGFSLHTGCVLILVFSTEILFVYSLSSFVREIFFSKIVFNLDDQVLSILSFCKL